MISDPEKLALILKAMKDYKEPEGIRGFIWKLSYYLLPDRVAESEPVATFLCWILGPDFE